MAKVEFKNLKKSYVDVAVVKQFDFTVDDGEFVVFLGPSGCGKSTTLRMLAGLESISSGEIYVGDKLMNSVDAKDRDLAMVFQSYALYPHMTVYENIAFALKLKGMSKNDIDTEVRKAAEMLELAPLLDRKPKALSGGQRQRVAMGRAMVRTPKVFLFDEPLSNLDAKLRGTMREEIKHLHRELKTTTIYVTHDQIEAMTLADRIVVMKDGYIQQHGTPRELFEKPSNKFVAGFIGMPPMNFLQLTVEKINDKFYALGENIKFELPHLSTAKSLPQTPEAIIGIRPSALTPGSESDIENAITFTINVNEYIGTQSVLISEVQGQRFMVEVDSLHDFKVGKTVRFKVDPKDIYVFDKDTEEAIY